MITVCVLNYHRSYFLTELLLPAIAHHDLVDEIIVSHGNEQHLFEYESDACRVVHRRDFGEVNEKFGLARRWLCWEMARNETILSIDEDIFLPPSSLDGLYARYARDSNVIHTLYGRCLSEQFAYSDTTMYGEVPIAGAGCSVLRRALGRACLDRMHLVEDFVRERSEPLWNGEDIFTSLVSISLSGRMNQAHPLPVRDLDMWGKPGISRMVTTHQAYRGDLSRYAINKLGLRQTMKSGGRATPPPPEQAASEKMPKEGAVAKSADERTAQSKEEPTEKSMKSAERAAEQVVESVEHAAAIEPVGRKSKGTAALTHIATSLRHKWRRGTDRASWAWAKACMRPRFYIFGADVVDTSALFACLAKHSSVVLPSSLAHGYHAAHYSMGEHSYTHRKEPKYIRHFPHRFLRREKVTGEHCAAYLYMPEVCHRMCINLPLAICDWRCVVVLRDPVERALLRFCRRRASAERLRVWRWLSRKSQATAVLENPDAADIELARRCGQMAGDEVKANSPVGEGQFDEAQFNEAMEKEVWCLENGLSPLLSGMPSAQLRRLFFHDDAQDFKFDDYNACTGGGVYAYWLDYLWRRVNTERVMVVRADDLYHDFDETYARVCDFIGLQRDARASAPRPPSTLPTVSASTRERWMSFFDEHSRAVFKRSRNRDALTRWLT